MSYQSKYSGITVDASVYDFLYGGYGILYTIEELKALDTTKIREGSRRYVINAGKEYIFKGGTWNVYAVSEAEHAITADRLSYAVKIWGQEFNGAKDLDGSQTVHGDSFISGKQEIGGKASLKGGASFGEYIPGLVGGRGGNISDEGRGELLSLILHEFLDVPEIRYNRTTVYMGDTIHSRAAGIAKYVIPDEDSEGNELRTGTIILKLEDNDFGTFDVDDLCMMIYSDMGNPTNNATETSDDGKGNRRIKGFATSMFRITSVGGVQNQVLTYQLRAVDSTWTSSIHPYAMGTIAQRGNTDDNKPERQKMIYTGLFPTSYIRFLKGVNTWEFGLNNIGMQIGDLDNMTVFGVDLTGYSAYLNNVYFSGKIQQIEMLNDVMELEQSLGGWMGVDDAETVTVHIYNGYHIDVTDKYVQFTVKRDSGDTPTDAEWNATHSNVTNPFVITFSDCNRRGASQLNTLFTVTAKRADSKTAENTISVS